MSQQPDEWTAHVRAQADAWRDIAAVSDDDAAEMIRRDGSTCSSTCRATARRTVCSSSRAARRRVQVTWLGYPNTTGMSAMDFRLTDAHADPPGMTESLHTEKARAAADQLVLHAAGERARRRPAAGVDARRRGRDLRLVQQPRQDHAGMAEACGRDILDAVSERSPDHQVERDRRSVGAGARRGRISRPVARHLLGRDADGAQHCRDTPRSTSCSTRSRTTARR
jgi:hypothetical protein